MDPKIPIFRLSEAAMKQQIAISRAYFLFLHQMPRPQNFKKLLPPRLP